MRICEIKSYVPENPYTNHDLAKNMDTNNEWIVKRTGIESRNWASESIEEMARKCIEQFETDAVDAIIVTTMSTINTAPSLSAICGKYIGSENCMCIDLNAACSGFVYGFQVAEGLLATGFKRVLILSIEKMSSIINKNDRSTAILFGDGACGLIVEGQGNKLCFKANRTSVDEHSLFKRDGEYLQMDGPAVFKFATKTIADCIDTYGDISDIDWFVFHQANKRIIDNVIRKYKIDKQKVVINIEKIGNTSSASIPLALSEIKIQPGQKVIMIGFGAGLSTGCVVYEH